MAVRVLEDAGSAAITDLTLLDARAQIELAQGRPDQAISKYLAAQRLAPDRADIRMALAEAYDAAGAQAVDEGRRQKALENYNCALASYETARQLTPNDEAIYDGIGKVMLHERRFDESVAGIRRRTEIRSFSVPVPARVHHAQALFNIGIEGDPKL